MSLCATGCPLPALLLAPFFFFFRARLTTVPRSLLLNRTETLATRAMADRESGVALCHKVALKKREREIACGPREQYRCVPRGGVKKEKKGKKMIGRGSRESCIAIPRFGINNALQGRKERYSKGVWERVESRSLLFQLIKRGQFLERTRTAPCSIPS